MIKKEEFCKWFNRDFWKAVRKSTFPIQIPLDRTAQCQLVERVFQSIVSCRYSPSIPEVELFINKGGGVARRVPVFCIEDYCVYYFCIKELEDILCVNRTPNTFGGWSLGGKLRKSEHSEIESESTDYGRYSFNPMAWREAFGEFNSILFSQLDQGLYTHVLQFDLSNFYDSIRLDILERWIREEADPNKGWVITLLFYLLNHWNRRNTGLHPQAVGIPQDALADCSRILANFYLQKYDKFASKICTSRNALYLRYADDQFILAGGREYFEILLLLLTRNLDRYGLRVNQKKIDVWFAEELEELRCRKIQSIFKERDDNKTPELVREFVDSYLKLSPEAVKKSWNSGHPLLNRLIYSNLESLPKEIFEEVFSRLTEDNYVLRADQWQLKRLYDLSRSSSFPYKLSAQLPRLLESCVHNSFHYEVLNFARNLKNADLEDLCVKRLTLIDSLIEEAESA
jgi:hypothetical protein